MLSHMLFGWRRSTKRRANRSHPSGPPSINGRSVRTLRPALESLENRVVPTGGLVVFGDSLSDVGNLSLSDGNVETPSPPYYDGRFSNGPLWVETLATYLGDPPLQPSSVGGTDYAWGGAQVAFPGYPPSIPQQISQYLDSLAAAGQTIAANDVFAVWAGTNDYFGTFLGANGPTNPIDPAASASALTDALQTLVTAGARTLVVNNLPLLGNSPYFQATDAFYQQGGALVASANAWTAIFNSDVATGLKALSGANVVLVDVAGLEEQVIQYPAQFGFTNTSGAVGPFPAPYGGLINSVTVSDPQDYFFFDGVHPTTKAQQLIGMTAAQDLGVAAPAAPTGLTATATTSQVALNWSPSSGATSYNIYRSTSKGGEGGAPIQTGVTLPTFTDTGLTNGTTYYYQVTAVDLGGESGKSNEASATPQANAIDVVTHFSVTGPPTATAGNPSPFLVKALDAFNNTATDYNGTVGFTSSDPQAVFSSSSATLTNGVGFFAAIMKTAGFQTLTATDSTTNTLTGASSSIAVSPGAVNHFAVTLTPLPAYPGVPGAYPTVSSAASSFASTGEPVYFTVTTEDSFNNFAPNYAGTVSFSSSDTAPDVLLPQDSTLTGGVGVFSAILATPGNQSIAATDLSSPAITGVSGPIVTRGLVVTSFAPTPSGFSIAFDKPFNPSTVFMYTAGSTPDDIILATTNSQVSVRGSAIFNANDTGFTFVKTDSISATGLFNPASGLLAAGQYTLTLRSLSGGNSFADTLGAPLDGTDTGSAGANYRITFSVSAPPVAVGIPDFARGPSNTDAVFLPSTLSNGSTFALSYTNPAANPTTGTATVTFNTAAATLQTNIQAALSSGGLATQIGLNAIVNNTPNSVVIVTNDTSTGANVLVTFQSALAQATNQPLSSTTAGVSIGLATINVANNLPGSGIPIGLSSGLGVTSGSFTLQYNPSLLMIIGTTAKAPGATFTLASNTMNSATSATAMVSLSSPASLSSTAVPTIMGALLATMPLSATAEYGAKQLLHFSSDSLAGTAGSIAVTNADAVQVAAYFGDVTDLGGPLSLQDAGGVAAVAGSVANTAAQTIPGFAAFPNLDPAIIGDVSLQGSVNSTDTGAMTQEVGGLARPTIPYAPIGLSVTPAGPGAFLPTKAGVRLSTGNPGITSPAVVGRAFAEMAPTPGESWQLETGEWLSNHAIVNPVRQSQGEMLASLARPVDSAVPQGAGVAFDPEAEIIADEADLSTALFPGTPRCVR
jgi:phospholipase/lecithinase/hemolysin